jgi:hypothetical protein
LAQNAHPFLFSVCNDRYRYLIILEIARSDQDAVQRLTPADFAW